MKFKTSLLACVVLALAGCKTSERIVVEPSVLSNSDRASNQKVLPNQQADKVGELTLKELGPLDSAGVTPPNTQQEAVPSFDDGKVTISADGLLIRDFIQLVFGEQLDLDYALSNKVRSKQERVSLTLRKPISKQQLYLNAKEILQQNKIAFKEKKGVYFFEELDLNKKDGFNLGVGRSLSDVPDVTGQILHVAPLYFADWRSINRITQSLTNSQTQYLAERNALLITGVRQQVEQVLKIVNAFDRPSAKGRHIGIVELVYLTPEELESQLTEIFAIEGLKVAEKGKEGIIAITPMKRMRSALVHSASKEIFDRVMYWTEKLDVPSTSDGRRYYTYFPKNVSAADMGKSLSKLFQLSGSKNQSSASSQDKPAEGGKKEASSSSSMQDLAMTVDEIQNALVFYATPSRYHEALELIERLDVMPGQVLIEAAVVEVTLDNNFSTGIDWSRKSGFAAQDKKSSLSIGNGLSYVIQGVDFNASLEFLESNSRIKIVSRPRVLVRDGRSANMSVGTEIPVITQTVSDIENTEQVLQTVQYRSTGVSLSVTPTINARGVVALNLTQSVSAVGEDKIDGINSPTILNRSFNTDLLAIDGKTIILGGLISEDSSDAGTSVPGFSKLPIIGNLFFGSKSERANRVELVVMITPRIIASEEGINEAIDAITSEYENFEFNL
ncbi:putative type II secretion system protein D precursor [Pseudoalteromonas sp. P1-9]|uniref:secretin N-terminal domain-containing protein n=1 Tax=Pseudoalteromonas sp. P1-9 TaxID=1710354 RepID=UPI0006D5DF88|nr:secretin N-terminal domain-containing protein [Pseudoalteromonas sp. P1-9]KPV96723.1 putative type II secretion system protein D precursor [Pseudoalteromonas sp. P1-9]